MKKMIPVIMLLSIIGCSSNSTQTIIDHKRVWVDSSTHKNAPPAWATSTKIAWEEGSNILFKSTQTVRGNERVNGCNELAKLDAKEALLSEIRNEVKGSISNAQQSISENAEIVLGKVRSADFEGKISGLRFTEEYFERYLIGETERIECHVLGQVTKQDYNQIKQSIINQIVAVDPKIKEAITKKQINFFEKTEAK